MRIPILFRSCWVAIFVSCEFYLGFFLMYALGTISKRNGKNSNRLMTFGWTRNKGKRLPKDKNECDLLTCDRLMCKHNYIIIHSNTTVANLCQFLEDRRYSYHSIYRSRQYDSRQLDIWVKYSGVIETRKRFRYPMPLKLYDRSIVRRQLAYRLLLLAENSPRA